MHTLTRTLQDAMNRCTLPINDRETFIALFLSRSIAFNLALPTSELEAPMQYFNDTHLQTVNDILSDVNEHQVIPFDETRNLIMKLWIYRYQMVFSPITQAMDLVLEVCAKDNTFNAGKVTAFCEAYADKKYTMRELWKEGAVIVNNYLTGKGD